MQHVYNKHETCDKCHGYIPAIGSTSADCICPNCYRLVENPELWAPTIDRGLNLIEKAG